MPLKAEVGASIDGLLSKEAVNPAGYVCFDKWEIKSLATFKKNCDRDREELQILQVQSEKYFSREEDENSRIAFWATVVVTFALGFVAGAGASN